VRKAFLLMDSDHDGLVTVEDFMRVFGGEADQHTANDLRKLLIDQDSSKQGKLSYEDFSKWIGSYIHVTEGFYFRHDSKRNPQFETNMARNSINENN
jgi:hypothetical protein